MKQSSQLPHPNPAVMKDHRHKHIKTDQNRMELDSDLISEINDLLVSADCGAVSVLVLMDLGGSSFTDH